MILSNETHKIHKVKIVKCGYFGYWYGNREVGETFMVREIDNENEFYLLQDDFEQMGKIQSLIAVFSVRCFNKNDCEILETFEV